MKENFAWSAPDGSERWVAARGRTVDAPAPMARAGWALCSTSLSVSAPSKILTRRLKRSKPERAARRGEPLFKRGDFRGQRFRRDHRQERRFEIRAHARRASGQTDATVLLQGETGVGKELVARAIHEKSSRSNGPLVKVNCAALPDALVESELFGHEKGAFTGADRQRKGRFELADGGTILLDEVAELPPGTQAKLLRVLQEGEFERVGGSSTIKVSVRVITATNRKLNDEVSAGRFRQDLFYRLNVYPITLPPLRQRREDIPLLVSHYARQIGERMDKSISEVPAQVMREFTEYNWPGNIRELQNVIERAVIISSDGVLRLPEPLGQATTAPASEVKTSKEPTIVSTADEAERENILRALEATGWRINGPKGPPQCSNSIHPR